MTQSFVSISFILKEKLANRFILIISGDICFTSSKVIMQDVPTKKPTIPIPHVPTQVSTPAPKVPVHAATTFLSSNNIDEEEEVKEPGRNSR